MAGHVQIGTQWAAPRRTPVTDPVVRPVLSLLVSPVVVCSTARRGNRARSGTLLAVVPIPGTGTSLAIVGYPVTAPGSVPGAAGSVPAGTVPVGLLPEGLVRDGRVLAGAALAGLAPPAGPPASVPGCCSTTSSGGSWWTAPKSR